MRVAIDYTPAVRQGAGIGRYTRGLVASLAEIEHPHEIVLVVMGSRREAASGALAADDAPDFPTVHVPLPYRLGTLLWHRLRLPLPAELFTGRIDLFHSTDFVLPPLRRGRGLMTVHDLAFLRVPECADTGLRAYLSRSVPRSIARAKHILADSSNTRRDLMELLHVPSERISVVPAGVERRFRPVDDEQELERVRTRYTLPEAFILSLGTLEPRKNYLRLIEAHARLRRRAPSAPPLLIAGGRGWLYEDIIRAAEEQGREAVRLLGYVKDEDLPALYTLADVFAFPSLYEGFGLPPLEAMACGTPVVCSDRPSLPEVAGNAALMVDAEDVAGLSAALQQVLEDTHLRSELVRSGRTQAQRFTWQAAARQLLAAYEAATQ